MAHANARLTVHGRALLVERVLAGHRPADVAHQLSCSRATAYKGKVERLNRTLLREWAYARVFVSNAERAAFLAPFLQHYNTRRRHSSLGGLPPISRLSTTW